MKNFKMIENFLEIAKDYFNIFDAVVFIIFIYCVIQCTGKGFTLSFFFVYEVDRGSNNYFYNSSKTTTLGI